MASRVVFRRHGIRLATPR